MTNSRFIDLSPVHDHITAKAFATKTIATGVITVTQTTESIITEGMAASDDLDTINGGATGLNNQFLILQAQDNGDTVTLKDSANMRIAGDFAMDSNQDHILLISKDATKWQEISRSDNTA